MISRYLYSKVKSAKTSGTIVIHPTKDEIQFLNDRNIPYTNLGYGGCLSINCEEFKSLLVT